MSYLEQLATAGKLKPCPECRSMDALRVVVFADTHRLYGQFHGAIVCDNCPDPHGDYDGQRRVDWAPKPKNLNGRPKRPRGSTRLLSALRDARCGEPLYCEICLRDERFLPPGTRMEAHHVIEHQDGGTDDAANLTALCHPCHELVHWRRREALGPQAGKPTEDEPEVMARASR